MSEADERLPSGPRGERGERGLSWLVAWAIVVLFAIAVVLEVGNLIWTAHEVSVSAAAQQRQAAAEQRKWCGLIVTLDEADAAAAKKPASGTFTAALIGEIHQLRQGLGCAP